MLPWQPEFHSDQPENIMQSFPLLDYASCEIVKIGYLAAEIYIVESLDDGRRRTPDHAILIAHSSLRLRYAKTKEREKPLKQEGMLLARTFAARILQLPPNKAFKKKPFSINIAPRA